MIDNFKLIKPLLTFPNDDIYYHLQILRRGKDHPELPAANRMIKAYFITDINDLDFYEQEIKGLCKFFEARAYINPTPKSIKKTTMLQLKYLTQRVYEGDFKKIWKSWNTCAGEIKGEESRWIVDYDYPYPESVHTEDDVWLLKACIDSNCEPVKMADGKYVSKIIAEIPTKNGVHLITKPFNLYQFEKVYSKIDVHKNNPTLLYCL